MPKRRVLVAWIGHSDLRALAVDSPQEYDARVGLSVGIDGGEGHRVGLVQPSGHGLT